MFTLARLFRKSKNFAFGLTFLPFLFYPILAFDNSEYVGINLAAMEGTSTTVDVPKVVEEEPNPVVHEEQDEASRNINISIGGGVYQKDYTNTLLQVDQKQTITMEPVKQNKPENTKNSFLMPEEVEEVKEEALPNSEASLQMPEQISTEPKSVITERNQNPTNIPEAKQPTIVMPEPITINSNPTPISSVDITPMSNTNVQPKVEPSKIESAVPKQSHQETEGFVTCPNCGAKVKSDASTCFLCGHSFLQKN